MTSYNFSPEFLSVVALNYKRMLASSMWVKTLLDADNVHYKNKDLNSWLYRRFNTITTLAPDHYIVYRQGGLYLAVIKDDITGAKNLYEKGLKQFPKDADLNYYYGMLLYTELKDPEGALPHLQTSLEATYNIKRKSYIAETIGGILRKTDGTDVALAYLQDLLHDVPEGSELRYRINAKIQALIQHRQRSGR